MQNAIGFKPTPKAYNDTNSAVYVTLNFIYYKILESRSQLTQGQSFCLF